MYTNHYPIGHLATITDRVTMRRTVERLFHVYTCSIALHGMQLLIQASPYYTTIAFLIY